MKKARAIEMLGRSVSAAATSLGISYQAVRQWPDELPPKIADRVFAAFVRLHPNDWQTIWPDLASVEREVTDA